MTYAEQGYYAMLHKLGFVGAVRGIAAGARVAPRRLLPQGVKRQDIASTGIDQATKLQKDDADAHP